MRIHASLREEAFSELMRKQFAALLSPLEYGQLSETVSLDLLARLTARLTQTGIARMKRSAPSTRSIVIAFVVVEAILFAAVIIHIVRR
jgi:hypothetical protein